VNAETTLAHDSWNEDKIRLLLLHKRTIMSKSRLRITMNLEKLKQSIEKFDKIGITHELSPTEREEN